MGEAMTEQNNGGSAFPQNDLSAYGIGPSEIGNRGMSLRDYFAGQVALECLGQTWAFVTAQKAPMDDDTSIYKIAALSAYEMADAMLAAREASHDL